MTRWETVEEKLLIKADTESRNHTMFEVGRDLWASCSAPLFKQGHPDQLVQDYVQMTFEYQSYQIINITVLQRAEEKHYLHWPKSKKR